MIGARFPNQCAPPAGSTVFVGDLTLGSGRQAQIVFNDDAGAQAGYVVPSWVTETTALLEGGLAAVGGSVIGIGNAPVLLE